ncbi:Cytochrome P450 [Amanita muscaria]
MAQTLTSTIALLRDVLRPSNAFLVAGIYVVCRLVYDLFIWRKFLSPLRHLPSPPGSEALFGHTRKMLYDETGVMLREWVKKYGPVLRIAGPGSNHNILIVEHEHLDKVLGKDAHNYPKPRAMLGVLEIISGYGLFAMSGNEHRLMRRSMSTAFSITNMMAQEHFHHDVADRLVKIWKDQIGSVTEPSKGKIINLYDYMSKATLDIISLAGFGYDADTLHNPENELAVAYKGRTRVQSGPNVLKLFYSMSIPGALKFVRSKWLYAHREWLKYTKPSADLGLLVESMQSITQLARGILDEKIKESASESAIEAKRDIMSILVRARKEELEKGPTVYTISDDVLTDQVLTFLGAGHTTTAITLTWALWSLANDQKSQNRLREEITPVLDANLHPDYRTLKALPWLDSVIMETIRIFPPVQVEMRIAEKTDYIGDVLVPKGSFIFIPVFVVNTYKGTWGEDAEEFNPSRWLNLPDTYHPNYSMLSFIAGPHHCIGRTMALMEMKAVLASLIYNFKFEPSFEGQTANLRRGIFMKFMDGMPVNISRARD